jgi:hypothetical protein
MVNKFTKSHIFYYTIRRTHCTHFGIGKVPTTGLCFLLYQMQLIQMEIPECPVLRPTMQEFKNFYEFVEKVDRTYKKDYGMVKVTPLQ